MLKQGELQTHCRVEVAPLTAHEYRRLWLDNAHALGIIAETLAEALGWQPTEHQPLPDAVELALAAVDRIAMLETQGVLATIRHGKGEINYLTINMN